MTPRVRISQGMSPAQSWGCLRLERESDGGGFRDLGDSCLQETVFEVNKSIGKHLRLAVACIAQSAATEAACILRFETREASIWSMFRNAHILVLKPLR